VSHKTSIIIPARNEPYLARTIHNLLTNAKGEIEIIALLDGYWPDPPLMEDPRVIQHHVGKAVGMRTLINIGAKLASGKYLMKIDAHCAVAPGYDLELAKSCKANYLVVPRRYELNVDTWQPEGKATDYMYISKPDLKKRSGFKGVRWIATDECSVSLNHDKEIDNLMTFQGSCWFMHKDYFFELGGLDDINYGSSGKEAQEWSCKVWLSKGRVIRNKKTWYAHTSLKRNYSLPNDERKKSYDYAVDTWLNNKWPGQKRNFDWMIQLFKPPGWEAELKTKKDVVIQSALQPKQNGETKTLKTIEEFLKIKKPGYRVTIPRGRRSVLPKLFNELGLKKGAEVGVAHGTFSELLCQKIPDIELMCVDPWLTYQLNVRGTVQAQHEDNYKLAQKRMAPYNATLFRGFSLDAVATVPYNSLDFVYIDGNHLFDYVMCDIIEWAKRVRPGGIISGHDYYNFRNANVIEAVDLYTKVHKIKNWYLTNERTPSFFWMKGDK